MGGGGAVGWFSQKINTFAITIDTLVTVQTELRQVNTQTLFNLFTVHRNNALGHFTIKRTALSTEQKLQILEDEKKGGKQVQYSKKKKVSE